MRHFVATYWYVLVILFLGAIGSWYLATQLYAIEKQTLLTRVSDLSKRLPITEIEDLAGTSDDLSNNSYLQLKSRMESLHVQNSDIRFLYLMGRLNTDNLFFYVDSEDPSSADYSPPGQSYPEASLQMKQVFVDGIPREDTDSDRWGSWVSAYAPIKNSSGAIIALLGIDITGSSLYLHIAVYAALPFSISVLFALLVMGSHMYRRGIHLFRSRKSREDALYQELQERINES